MDGSVSEQLKVYFGGRPLGGTKIDLELTVGGISLPVEWMPGWQAMERKSGSAARRKVKRWD